MSRRADDRPLPTWHIGDVRVTCLTEVLLDVPTAAMLPTASGPEMDPGRRWLEPDFVVGADIVRMAINAFVVEWPGGRLVVDTGVGAGKARTYPLPDDRRDFLEALARAGCPPDDVDLVLCTHLHWDHVSGNTVRRGLDWVPTFPKARYLVSRAEWAFWAARRDAGLPPVFDSDATLADSFDPVRAAGLVDLVEGDEVLAPALRLLPSPGHTPGHVALWIETAGRAGTVTGDLIHSPVQMLRPDWSHADVDPRVATRTRRELLDRCATTDALVLGTHFPPPTAGRVIADGQTWRFAPVPGQPFPGDPVGDGRDGPPGDLVR
ncbi:MAG TPA: MBL fold metallo-hydrolase [Acidimicrobiales bacterium]|nr:MBL fold metallo-hydrolase [Acidimicrobiales bacterium]